MKKLLLIFILSTLCINYVNAIILSGSCGDNATFVLNEDGSFYINGYGEMSDYTSKEKRPWNSLCTHIKSLYISHGITSIGNYSFAGCSNLTEVTLPNSLTRIGKSVFEGCLSLKEIEIPGSVEKLQANMFKGCDLYKIILNEGLKSIERYAFIGNLNIERLFFPNSVTSVEDAALVIGNLNQEKKVKLNELIIGNGLTEFGAITSEINIGWSFPMKVVFGESISSISDAELFYRGSGYGLMPGANLYLLTDNVVSFSGCPYNRMPDCKIFVADSTKYTADAINSYKIQNIIHTKSFTGEYTGKVPEIDYSCALDNFNISIDPKYSLVGEYDHAVFILDNGELSSRITVPCNFNITKAPLSILANNKTIYYGEDIPKLDCSYIGLKNNEAAEYALSTLPSLSTTAKKGSTAGTYNINIGGAESKNYSLSYTSGTLTIKKALQDITWNQIFDTSYIGDVVELNAISSSGLPITYISSNENIAFVTRENDKQLLYFVKDGIVKITATQQGNENYESAVEVSKSFNVIAKVATNITLNQSSIRLKEGESATLVATIYPESVIEKGVEWSSSNNDVATVNNGMVTAIKVGTATITARTIDGSNLEATCNVTVNPILVSSINLSSSTLNLNVGEYAILSVTITPDNATNKNVEWSSSNSSIASVSNGIVTAMTSGSCVIKAKTTDGSEIESSCVVTVANIPVTNLTLDKESIEILVDEEATISANVYPANATNQTLSWTSSNGNVATVDGGLVTARGAGETVITVRSTDGSDKMATCNVVVKKHQQTIEWNQDLSSIVYGGELIEIHAEASSGLPVVYSSSNDNVISIFDMGSVVYLNPINVGTSVVTVTQAGNRYYEEISVSKEAKVIDPSSVENIEANNGKYIVYMVNGLRVGTFTKDEYVYYMHNTATKGIYIVNGSKIIKDR